jgi:hypothetical protein
MFIVFNLIKSGKNPFFVTYLQYSLAFLLHSYASRVVSTTFGALQHHNHAVEKRRKKEKKKKKTAFSLYFATE